MRPTLVAPFLLRAPPGFTRLARRALLVAVPLLVMHACSPCRENEVPMPADGIVKVEIDTRAAKELHGDSDHKYSLTAEVVDVIVLLWQWDRLNGG